MRTLFTLAAALALAFVGVTELDAQAGWRSLFSRHRGTPHGLAPPRGAYALDAVPRHVAREADVECASEDMVRFRGGDVRYSPTARVHPDFVPRLEAFEEVLVDLAERHYGRAPRRLHHVGAYACRRSRGRTTRVSEHALGNALDLEGLDFGPLARDATLPEHLPRRLRRSFQVSVGSHWSPRRERDRMHADFLHALADTLRDRPDIFRGMVGPPRPRHHGHLHLDAAPWRYAMYHYD